MDKLVRLSVPVLISVLALSVAGSAALASTIQVPTITSVTIGSQTGALVYGTANSVTYTVTVNRSSNGNETATLAATSIPPNFTSALSSQTVTFSGNNASASTTLTLTSNSSTIVQSATSFTVTATGTTAVSGNGAVSVGKRAVTITADAKTKNVGDVDPTLTYQITSGSLVNSNTFSGSLTRAAGELAGIYAILQGTVALSSSYTLSYVGANLTISAASTSQAITVTTHAPATAVYGSTFSVAATASSTLPVAITVSGSCSISGSTVTMTSGTGSCSVLYNQAGNGTYSAAPQVTETVSATQKTVTASVSASNKVYDANATASVSCGLTGLVAPDNVTCAATASTFSDKTVAAGKTVTATGISLSGVKAPNYQLSSTSATTTAAITAKDLTVSLVAGSKVFDGTTAAGTLLFSTNKISGDTVTVGNTGASFDASSVGSHTVTATGLSLGGTDGGNYNLLNSSASASASITPEAADVTFDLANIWTLIYNASTHAITATAVGHTDGNPVAVKVYYDGLLTAPSHVGTYSVTALTDNANYSGSTTPQSLVISKANAVIAVTPYSVTFDGSPHTATGSATGVGSDGSLSGLDLSGTTHSVVGSYPTDSWVFTDVTGNYNDASSTVGDEITAAPVSNPVVGLSGGGAGGGTSNTLSVLTLTPGTSTPAVGEVLGVSTSTVPVSSLTNESTTTPGKVLGVSTFVFTKNLHYRMHGSDVSELQKLLVGKGYGIRDSVTEYFGPQTRAAVKAFQKASGLPQTGFVGSVTRALLNKAS